MNAVKDKTKRKVRACVNCGGIFESPSRCGRPNVLCDRCLNPSCLTCGKQIVRSQRGRRPQRYCSLRCRDIGRKGIPLKGKKTVHCATCGNSFEVFPCRVGAIKYCSKDCGKTGLKKNLSSAGRKLRADPAYRAAQSTRTAGSWLDIEKKANHLAAVRTPEHRRLRSQIGKERWAAPDSKARAAFGAYLKSSKFREDMRKRPTPAPIKWRIYRRPDGTEMKMRSLWEVSYATWLDMMGLPWQYEPERFELSDGRPYTPDFKVESPFGPAFVELHRFTKIKPGDERKIEKLKLAQKELPLPLVFVGEEDVARIRRAVNAG